MFTLSEARDQAKPILLGLLDDDLLVILNEVLAERPATLTSQEIDALRKATKQHQADNATGLARGAALYRDQKGGSTGTSVAAGRELYRKQHGK